MYFKLRLNRTVQAVLIIVLVFALSFVLQFNSSTAVPTSAEKSISLPIIMYHSFLKDSSMQNDYCISPDVLENDLKYITENGYTAVTISDLTDYVNGKDLDDKIVMLTFDDGFYNNFTYAYPLLKKYKCKGVISPVASLTLQYSQSNVKSSSYGYCSFKELYKMQKSGYIEIANHSYNMHSTYPRLGIGQMQGEDDLEYKKTIVSDIKKAQKLLKDNNIKKPVCFTYPYGIETSSTLEIIKDLGFVCTLTCAEKKNIITRDKSCLYELGSFLRTQSESSENFFERINE